MFGTMLGPAVSINWSAPNELNNRRNQSIQKYGYLISKAKGNNGVTN